MSKTIAVPIAQSGAADGEQAVAFARPHELDILTGSAEHGVRARVSRMLLIGAAARVHLTLVDASNGDSGPQLLEVELARRKLTDLGLQPRQPVRLTSSQLRVFPRRRRASERTLGSD